MSSDTFPTGICAAGGECNYPQCELRPEHTCPSWSLINHITCAEFDNETDKYWCPNCLASEVAQRKQLIHNITDSTQGNEALKAASDLTSNTGANTVDSSNDSECSYNNAKITYLSSGNDPKVLFAMLVGVGYMLKLLICQAEMIQKFSLQC